MSQWQSLCFALAVSITSASTASPQALTGVDVQNGDVWLLPGDRVSPTVVLPQVSSSNGALPTGDVWLLPDDRTIPSVTAEEFHPEDAALATRNE